MTLDDIMKHSTLTLRTQPSPIDAHTNGNQRADELPAVEQVSGEMTAKNLPLSELFVGFVSHFYDRSILEGHYHKKTQAKMDEKNTKLPAAADDAVSANDGSNTPISLGHQAFDVFKDVLIGDLVEENRKLQVENEKLAPVDETLNSTLTLLLAGRKYTSDLRNGRGCRNGSLLVPIENAEPVPLLDLAGPPVHLGPVFLNQLNDFDEGPRLVVSLGNIEVGALNMKSRFRGGKLEAKRVVLDENENGVPFLYIWLEWRVMVGGRLTNISDEDLSGNFRYFNQQASARLMMGFPAAIKNEENLTFTIMQIYLFMKSPGFKETVDLLLTCKHESEVLDAPCIVLPALVDNVLEDDGTFSKILEESISLNVRNVKLLAARERLGTVDVHYQGGPFRLSLENCRIIKVPPETRAILDFPSLSDGLTTVKLPQLKTTHVTLAGFDDISNLGMPTFFTNSTMVAIPFGPEVKLIGILDFTGVADTFDWPGDNPHFTIVHAIHGIITLPDEVVFKFVALEFDCSRLDSRVVPLLKILGVLPKIEESDDVPGVDIN